MNEALGIALPVAAAMASRTMLSVMLADHMDRSRYSESATHEWKYKGYGGRYKGATAREAYDHRLGEGAFDSRVGALRRSVVRRAVVTVAFAVLVPLYGLWFAGAGEPLSLSVVYLLAASAAVGTVMAGLGVLGARMRWPFNPLRTAWAVFMWAVAIVTFLRTIPPERLW